MKNMFYRVFSLVWLKDIVEGKEKEVWVPPKTLFLPKWMESGRRSRVEIFRSSY